MSRPLKVLVVSGAMVAVAVLSACGSQNISVPKSNTAVYHGATLFSQRCGGCHTLSYAATHGSASNIKTRLIENGPNFNLRCERPAIRVLYAIENGGFSGATMPQNIVVGQDARDVALFVSTYAGRKGIQSVGVPPCEKLPLGVLPAAGAAAPTTATPTTTTPTTATPTTATSSTTTPTKARKHKKKAAQAAAKAKSARRRAGK